MTISGVLADSYSLRLTIVRSQMFPLISLITHLVSVFIRSSMVRGMFTQTRDLIYLHKTKSKGI